LLLLERKCRDLVDERGRNDDGAVVVGNDQVVGKHRDAAAADRFLPVDERQSGHRRRRGRAGAPHRQLRPENAVQIATTPSVTSAATPR
jgi:hypothetical protein